MNQSPRFTEFVVLTHHDAPDLIARCTADELRIDGSRYGVTSRLIARPEATIVDLAARTCAKLLATHRLPASAIAGLVLSSRTYDVDACARSVAERLHLAVETCGVERACSGFPAATREAVKMCQRLGGPVAVVAAEIISRSINWEPPDGTPEDHRRARGQASKLFADGAAATFVMPADGTCRREILDAWVDEVPDEKRMIQKIPVPHITTPWGAQVPGETDCMIMPGRGGYYLLKTAPRVMIEALERSWRTVPGTGHAADLRVDHVIPHQANGLMMPLLEKQLKSHAWGETAVLHNKIAHLGNTVSATVPMAVAQVQHEIPAGALVGMPTAGAGGPGYRPDVMSCGCVLVRW